MSIQISVRRPHAVLNLTSRQWEGEKIAYLLDLSNRPQPMRRLRRYRPLFRHALHVAAQVCRRGRGGRLPRTNSYTYQQVESVELSFAAASFDVVITNHVIEHVGEADAQHRHLAEVGRIMKPDGTGYLAVPNCWMLTEPHYRLKFLIWWPHAWRSPYLRLMHKGTFYDCEPLQMRQLERMLTAAGFRYRNICIEAWRETFEIERPQSIGTRVLRVAPDAPLKPLRRIIPTLIYRVEPQRAHV